MLKISTFSCKFRKTDGDSKTFPMVFYTSCESMQNNCKFYTGIYFPLKWPVSHLNLGQRLIPKLLTSLDTC